MGEEARKKTKRNSENGACVIVREVSEVACDSESCDGTFSPSRNTCTAGVNLSVKLRTELKGEVYRARALQKKRQKN